MMRSSSPYELAYTPQGEGGVPFCLRLTLERDRIKKVSVEGDDITTATERRLENLDVRAARAVLGGLGCPNALSRELAFMQGMENLLGLTIPSEVRLLRVLLLEGERVVEHLQTLSWIALDVRLTPVVRAIRRLLQVFGELVVSLNKARTSNIDAHYLRPSLCGFLVPGGFEPAFLQDRPLERFALWVRFFEKLVPPLVRFIETLLLHNPLFQDRTVGLGNIRPADIIAYGFSGPIARSSGVSFDRRLFPESDHSILGLKISEPVITTLPQSCGDVFARTCRCVSEILQSLNLIDQVKQLFQTTAPFFGSENPGEKTPERKFLECFQGPWDPQQSTNYPVKDVASYVEASCGEFGFFMVSHGEQTLHCCQMTSPSFKALQALEGLLIDFSITDLALMLHSLIMTL